MKVLFVVPHNIVHETDMIIGLKHKGVDAYVATGVQREPDSSKLAAAGIPLAHIPFKSRLNLKTVARLREILSSFKPDIVHAFNNKTVSNALIACRGTPVRFIAYRGIVGNVSFLNPGSWMTYLNARVDRIVCVAGAIRDYLSGQHTPAIALTAFARSEDRTRALQAGFMIHVAKPVEADEFLATVASIAGRTGPRINK